MSEFEFVLTLDRPYLYLLLGVAVASAFLAWLITHLVHQRRHAALQTRLELERRAVSERLNEMEHAFTALSHEALKSNSETFLQLAGESLKRYHLQAQNELEKREQAVDGLIRPIRDALEKTDRQIQAMEKERKEAYGSLHRHLQSMAETQQLLHGETRNLVQALRRPEVRGQWGELTLRRLAELAGMVEHCDFFEQEQVRTDEGALRPDMVVRMPAGREVVVDVKTPLDAYLSAVEAGDDETRTRFLQHHARKVRERVRELAGKAYWNQFRNAPEFVVLFIPGEQFLSAALDIDRGLLEDALAKKVILATPTSFVALLRAIAYGWRQESLAANAEKIQQVGESLYTRLATFAEHLARLGKSLDSSVAHFNRAVGSFDTNLVPGARKFTELGLTSQKPLEAPEQIEKGVREVTPPEKE
jgi:DNA recombination protein RmuC